jgi:hypothetical protein
LKAVITLLRLLLLSDYPSGSAISYYDGQLFVVGDDAGKLLVLDSNYTEVNAITLFDYQGKRIPKAQKADLETASIVTINGKDNLLILGSAATSERERGVLLPLPLSEQPPKHISFSTFTNRLKTLGIPELNIEGSAVVNDHIVLTNRGNETNAVNHLIVTPSNFWTSQEDVAISLHKLVIPFDLPAFAGVSELCYIPEKDILLVVLSSEATANAYDDGMIGDSYVGWISHASRRINAHDITLDGIINLSEADPAFKGEKIEGICLASVDGKECLLHLVADNDQGQSKLFYVRLAIEED